MKAKIMLLCLVLALSIVDAYYTNEHLLHYEDFEDFRVEGVTQWNWTTTEYVTLVDHNYGKAAYLNGSQHLSTSVRMNITAAGYSVCFIADPTDDQSNDSMYLFEYHSNANYKNIRAHFSPNIKMQVARHALPTVYIADINTTMDPGDTKHLYCFIVDSTDDDVSIYVDGVQKSIFEDAGDVQYGYNKDIPFTLGSAFNGLGNNAFVGYIDEFYVFDSPLTDTEISELNSFYVSAENEVPTATLEYDNPVYILIPSFPISQFVNITPSDTEGDTIYYATDQDYGFVESGFGYEQTYGTDCDNTNWAEGTGNDGRWIIWKKFLGQYLDAYIPGSELCAPESFSANGCWEPHYTLNSSSAPKVISKNGDCALSFGQYSEEIVFQYLRSTERTRDIEVKVGMDFSAYSKLNITLYNQHNVVFNFSVYANGTQLDVRHGQTTYWNQSRYSTDSGGNLRNSFIQLRITTYPNGTVKVLRGTIPPSSEYLMFSGTTSDPWTEIGFAGEFLESIDDFRLTYPSYQGLTFTTTKPTSCSLSKMGWNYCKYYITDGYHEPYQWREYVASIEVLPSDLRPQLPNPESNITKTEKEAAASGWREFWQGIRMANGRSFDQTIESYFFWMFGIMFVIGLFSTKNFMFTWTGASAICLVIALIQGWPIPAATMVVSLSAAIALSVRP